MLRLPHTAVGAGIATNGQVCMALAAPASRPSSRTIMGWDGEVDVIHETEYITRTSLNCTEKVYTNMHSVIHPC